ncbi:MAG TPA: hypothetical protein VGB42_08600 [Candidatus Thermoplasmatota archaeon]
MARRDDDSTELIITVPLRRLLTGVPRTQRAAAALPRIKRFVRRHVKSQWLEAVTTDDEPDGKVWIDDSLNMTIWRRGREHVAGPAEWEEPKGGGAPRLTRRTSVRYGSVLKVRVYFNEEPEDGSDPRLELTLPGIEHITRQERRERRRRKERGEAEEGDEPGEGEEDEASESGEGAEGAGGDEEADDEDEEQEEGEEEAVKAPVPPPKSSKAAPAKAVPKKKAKREEGED